MQVCQQIDVDIVPPASNYIKNETPAKTFFAKFTNFFSL